MSCDETMRHDRRAVRTALERSVVGVDLTVDDTGNFAPHDFWLKTTGLDEFYHVALDLLGALDGCDVVDCGCGPGHTAVMLYRRGARVHAFDPSLECIETAKLVRNANAAEIDLTQQSFETLDYPSDSFDCTFGSCVIHHTEVDKTVAQLGRILKPGGRGVFIENSDRNPLLNLARRHLVGRFGIRKWSDDADEHPLKDDEITRMRRGFLGSLRVEYPQLVFFRLLDLYVFRRRSRVLTALLRGLDRSLGKSRWLRGYSYFRILVFVKTAAGPHAPQS